MELASSIIGNLSNTKGNTMRLFTKAIEARLAKNGLASGKDHKPVLKLFGGAAATWLITESDPDNPDILFGLCDLGLGFAELGSVSRSELESLRFPPFGLGVERDKFFKADYPLSVYVKASNGERITQDRKALEQAVNAK